MNNPCQELYEMIQALFQKMIVLFTRQYNNRKFEEQLLDIIFFFKIFHQNSLSCSFFSYFFHTFKYEE